MLNEANLKELGLGMCVFRVRAANETLLEQGRCSVLVKDRKIPYDVRARAFAIRSDDVSVAIVER